MPPIDWIHVAMFIAGLALQYLTSRTSMPSIIPPPAPTPAPAAVPSTDTKPLLDLVHKLLDQRQATTPQLDTQTLQAWMGVVNKLLDQPTTAPTVKT